MRVKIKNGNKTEKEKKMKKIFVLGLTVLILSLAFVGCNDNGDTSGILTVSNLPNFSGKFVMIIISSGTNVAAGGDVGITSPITLKAGSSPTPSSPNFDSTGTFNVVIYVFPGSTPSGSPETTRLASDIEFTNGCATINWNTMTSM